MKAISMYTCKLTDTRCKRLLNRREREKVRERRGFRYKKKVCVASSDGGEIISGKNGRVTKFSRRKIDKARAGRKDRVAIVIKIKFN